MVKRFPIGMVEVSKFEVSRGELAEAELSRLVALLEKFSLPVEMQTPKSFQGKSLSERRKIWETALRADKKRTGKDCAFIFIGKLGSCMEGFQQVPFSEVVNYLEQE